MLNQTVLVGRLTKDPEIVNTDSGKKVSTIILAVQRCYKNMDGLYDTDFIKCILWNGIAENTVNYCHSGDVVGIKGRLQSDSYLDDAGKTKYITEVIAEKVTFLTTKKEEAK